MFSFRKFHFRLVGLFVWGYAGTQFLLSVSRNQYGFTLAGYRNEKSATDPALIHRISFSPVACRRWVNVGPTVKKPLAQRRQPMSDRRMCRRWANVGPTVECYLGTALEVQSEGEGVRCGAVKIFVQ